MNFCPSLYLDSMLKDLRFLPAKLVAPVNTMTGRREFLKFLAGSPLLAALGLPRSLHGQYLENNEMGERLITEVGEALNVFDF